MVQIYERTKNILLSISFGLVFILILGYMYLNTNTLFPSNTAAWKDYVQTSIIFITLFLGFASAVSTKATAPLFRISFLKEFWKFVIAALIGFGSFWLIGLTVKGSALPSVASSLSGISIGVLMLYAFLVSFPEELIFRGRVADELKSRGLRSFWIYAITIGIFTLYHWAIGRSIFTLIVYIPLGFILMYVKNKFSPVTNLANAGVHFAWDIFILAFFP